MRDEDQCFFAGAVPTPSEANGRVEAAPQAQRMHGVAGRLRPYRDLRAGFEPWRRLALAAWSAREEAYPVH